MREQAVKTTESKTRAIAVNMSLQKKDKVMAHPIATKAAPIMQQGNQIHLVSGQEKHSPHEAWHVVQQKHYKTKPSAHTKTCTYSKNGTSPMQFVLAIENSANVYEDLIAVRGNIPLNKSEGKIFSNWQKSPTHHDFASAIKLNEALQSAINIRAMEPGTNLIKSKGLPDPPPLFSQAHLQFLTSTGGARLETLYFSDGLNSSRIRQQHPSGPLVQEPRTGKVDYFGTKDELSEIKERAKAEQKRDLNQRGFEMVRDIIHNDYSAHEAFQLNQNHLEVWYDDAGNYINNHPSQGNTVADPGYTDSDIKQIYSKVVGRVI